MCGFDDVRRNYYFENEVSGRKEVKGSKKDQEF